MRDDTKIPAGISNIAVVEDNVVDEITSPLLNRNAIGIKAGKLAPVAVTVYPPNPEVTEGSKKNNSGTSTFR